MNPHRSLPARTTTVGDEFWFEGWLWEAALVEITSREQAMTTMIRARSVAPPHHYATIALPLEATVVYLHKEYA